MMRKQLVSLLFLFFISLFPCIAFAVEEYTIDDILKMALQKAERIRISEEEIFIAQMGKDKAQASLIPKLSVFGGYTKFSEDKYALGGTVIQADRAYSYGVRLDQSYSLGGKEFKLFDISKQNIEKVLNDSTSVREDYLINVANAFYDTLRAQRYLEIARSNVERLSKHKRAAEVRLKVGEVTKTTLLRAEAELSGARSEMIKSENNLKLSKAVLARLVGIDREFELSDRSDRFKQNEEVFKVSTVDALVNEALQHRTEVRSAILQKEMATRQVSVAESAYYPTINLEGVYTKAGMNPESLSLVKESLYGAIKVTFPIYEAGMRRAEVREAEAKARQSSLVVDDIKKSVSVDVKKAYLDFLTFKDTLQALRDQVTFARDNYNAVSRQFEFGLANSIDVMDANNLLVTSEQRLSETEYNFMLSILRIKRAIGRPLMDAIKQ
ncbi:MAG: TolC family protein [Thermodesulfovibrionales bacterium]|nr:TolC family protein [Thermodesulfovibrionales bacterium]